MIGLIGPNGAGKTTLLEILALLSPPDSGELWYGGERVDFNSPRQHKLRKKIVLVQQQPILFTTTVFSNVEYPLKIRGSLKQEREKIVEELISLVGLEGFRDAKAHRLSGGETQRIAIAQALACTPDVILLDEPMASVDVENQITIERIIRQINREKGISIILTTHDMIQASRMADEIVFLFNGMVAESVHENIFSGLIETDPVGRKVCVLQDGVGFPVETDRSGPVRISINSRALNIHTDSDTPSEGYRFRGRLIQFADEKGNVRVLVDVGVPLSVLVPKEELKRLNLNMGDEVGLVCPDEGIEFF